jgi:hypothetical protein
VHATDVAILRAIVDDAGNIISGEDVKISGFKVGSVTPPQIQAAVVLKTERHGFQDLCAAANCTMRPQAMVGEKFVDCLPIPDGRDIQHSDVGFQVEMRAALDDLPDDLEEAILAFDTQVTMESGPDLPITA